MQDKVFHIKDIQEFLNTKGYAWDGRVHDAKDKRDYTLDYISSKQFLSKTLTDEDLNNDSNDYIIKLSRFNYLEAKTSRNKDVSSLIYEDEDYKNEGEASRVYRIKFDALSFALSSFGRKKPEIWNLSWRKFMLAKNPREFAFVLGDQTNAWFENETKALTNAIEEIFSNNKLTEEDKKELVYEESRKYVNKITLKNKIDSQIEMALRKRAKFKRELEKAFTQKVLNEDDKKELVYEESRKYVNKITLKNKIDSQIEMALREKDSGKEK